MVRHLSNLDRQDVLAFMLVAGPLAWSLNLILKFVLASNACQNPSASHRWMFQPWFFILLDVLAIAIASAAAWTAYQSWRKTGTGRGNQIHVVTEIGESRQHFLALWGMLIGAMFLSAIAFGLVADITVKPCTS